DRGRSLAEADLPLLRDVLPFDMHAPLVLGGRRSAERRVDGHFNGRLEHPAILHGRIDTAALLPWLRGDVVDAPGRVHAEWDFSVGIDTDVIEDRGPHRLHGVLHNMPKRGVRGMGWSGECLDWRRCPRDYAAIHFHDDDLDDA